MRGRLPFPGRRSKLKNNVSLNEAVSKDIAALAEQFLSFDHSNFALQTKFLGLNPRTDFRDADLAGVDFSNSNVCGYDFTGSDLRGATGVNVVWDRTTIFRNAQLTSSVFAYAKSKDDFFDKNPELAERVSRLNKEHWAGTILGVADLLDTKKVTSDSLWIAKSLFDQTASLPVRSNILYFMSPVSGDREQHKDFIYNTLARYGDQPSIIRSGLRTINALYSRDIGAVNILAAYLDHPDLTIRNEALRGILKSPFFYRAQEKILKYVIASGDSLLRRQFVGRAARTLGEKYVEAVLDPETKNYLDFAECVASRKLTLMAEVSYRREKFTSMSEEQRRNPQLENSLRIDDLVVRQKISDYLRSLRYMQKTFNIPFIFEK